MVTSEEGLMGVKNPESMLKHFDKDETLQGLSDAILSKLDDKAPMSYKVKRLLWQTILGAGTGYGAYEALNED